jgi:hypothetical protein
MRSFRMSSPGPLRGTQPTSSLRGGTRPSHPAYFTASEKMRLRLFTSNAPFAGTTVA